MRRSIALACCSLALAGCSVLPDRDGSTRREAPGPARVTPPPQLAQCLSGLAASAARFSVVPDRYTGPGCSTLGTVQLTSVQTDTAMLTIGNIGPATCEVSQAFAGWTRYGVDRAAREILGAPVTRIETFGSYSCRNVAGSSRRSGHATATAIDVAGFVLADGRRITVSQGWREGSEAERRFLRTVQSSACRRFATVLGPEYDAAHADHFHLEGVAKPPDRTGYCR